MSLVRFAAALGLALGAVCCGGAGVQSSPSAPATEVSPAIAASDGGPAPPATGEEDAAIPVSARDPSWGSRLALVTIVEFADFQCPFCQRAEAALQAVRSAYGPDKVRIVWKNDPLSFHPNARPAAEAAMGAFALAGSEGFWKFHRLAFDHQGSLGPEGYLEWAREAGVASSDLAAFRAGLDDHRWAAQVDRGVAEGDAAGFEGVPSFFINGVLLSGAQPFEELRSIVDQELASAQAAVDSGTPRERVYAKQAAVNVAAAAAERAAADKARRDADDDSGVVYRVPLGKSPARGSPGALVTMVEFSDFQCPFCARVEPTLEALRAKYGDALRLVWKNDPLAFHAAAGPAAEAAMEVRAEKGDAAFWAMHDALFAEQRSLVAGDVADVDAIVAIAAAAGANAGRVKQAIALRSHGKEIDADGDVAADFQVNGTPQFFINGRRLVGAQPQERFEAVIDDEIVKARALLAAGMKPADLYGARIKDGRGPPELERRPVPASLPAGDPVLGGAAARVVVHEWADFQCPFCGKVESALAALAKDYGKRVRLVWHDLPLPMHPDARLAAQAAREAYAQKGDTGFWAMHDLLLANRQALARADLDARARAAGLSMDRWAAALDGAAHAQAIEADVKAAGEAGIGGTPAFLVVPAGASSGYFIGGAQPYARFRRIVERALSDVK